MTLATRLTLTTVLLVAGTAAAAGFFAFRNVESIVVPLELGHEAERVRTRAERLNAFVAIAKPDLLATRASGAVRGIVRASEAGGVDPTGRIPGETWRVSLESTWIARLEATQSYREVRLLSFDGRELVRVERSAGVRAVPRAVLESHGDTALLGDLRELGGDDFYVSRIEPSREHGEIERLPSPVLQMGIPVRGGGAEPFGFLLIDLDMGPAFVALRASGEHGSAVFLVDERGDYLLHTDPAREFASHLGQPTDWTADFPAIAAALRERGNAVDAGSGPSERRRATTAASLRLGGDGPWIGVIETMPYASLTTAAQAFRRSTLAVAGIAALVALAISLIVARSLAAPIERLTSAVTQFGGDEVVPLEVASGGEVGALSRTLSHMMNQIVERTASLRASSEQRRLLAAVVDSSEDAIIATTLDGRITAWNPAAERIYGFSAVEAVGKRIDIVIPEDRRDEIEPNLECARRGRPMEFAVRRHADGSFVDVSLTTFSVHDERGAILGVSTIARDTRRQRLAESRFRTAVEASPNGMVIVDDGGIIRHVNAEMERTFGYTREELVGRGIDVLVPDSFAASHAKHREHYRSKPERRAMGVGRDLYARRKDGSEFPVEIALSPFVADDGSTNVIAVVVDITARKQAEEGLARYADQLKDSNDELQQFAYVVSHDLKAPLRGISAVAEWLAEDFGDSIDADTRENIELMLERTRRLSHLIDGILAYSRVGRESVEPEEIDAGALVTDVISAVAPPESVTIRTLGPFPRVVYGETQLRQVFQNLIQNAIQHHGRPVGTIEIACGDEGAHWRFHVRDDGIGVPVRHMERIFGLFQTLKPKDEVSSTGVGLSIVKRIVERNGGRVTVGASSTGGADFSFTVAKDRVAQRTRREEGVLS